MKRWESQLGVGLRAAIAKVVRRGRVIVAPADDGELSLDERLARFDPKRHGGEVMITIPVGVERP